MRAALILALLAASAPFVACDRRAALEANGDDSEPNNADKGISASDVGADIGAPRPDLGGQQDSGAPQTDGSAPLDSGAGPPKDGGSTTAGPVLTPAKCGGSAKLYLAEVATGQPDYLVLINKGSAKVDLKGFQLVMIGIDKVNYTFAAGVSVAAGATVYVFEYSEGKKAGDINTGHNIPFFDNLQSNAVGLYDASGNLLDFVTIGDKAVGVPSGATAGPVAWPKGFDKTAQSFQRKAFAGACPAFEASDWVVKAITRP